jgi:hypothetical protein
MERQAGLGRSLGEVLDSLTPPEPDASGPERALFEPEDLERQLDQLMGDMRDLRERVQHLVGLVPDDVLAQAPTGQQLSLVKPPKRDKHGPGDGKDQSAKKQAKQGKKKKRKSAKKQAKQGNAMGSEPTT